MTTPSQVRSKNDRGKPPSALVLRAWLPPHPGPLPGERENRPPLRGESRAPRLVGGRDAVFPLLRERVRVRGNQTQPTKTAGRIQPLGRLHTTKFERLERRQRRPSRLKQATISIVGDAELRAVLDLSDGFKLVFKRGKEGIPFLRPLHEGQVKIGTKRQRLL